MTLRGNLNNVASDEARVAGAQAARAGFHNPVLLFRTRICSQGRECQPTHFVAVHSSLNNEVIHDTSQSITPSITQPTSYSTHFKQSSPTDSACFYQDLSRVFILSLPHSRYGTLLSITSHSVVAVSGCLPAWMNACTHVHKLLSESPLTS